jgi:hypothetical protein
VREIADRRVRLGVDPGGEEALQPLTGLVDHAERRVAGLRQLRGRLDDPLQERLQRELRAERDPRVHEDAEAVDLVAARGHRRILAASRTCRRRSL